MKMIWAVVRSSKVELIARRLKDIGVSGCTVSSVRGYGEEWHLYEPLIHGGHHKLEVIVDEDHADKVLREITEHASTGLVGDGLLAIFDVATVVRVRSGQQFKNHRAGES